MNNFLDNSRATHRAKRKKINIILNGAIVIVLILIAFVSYSVFSSGDNKSASQKSVQASDEKQSAQNIKNDKPAEKESSTSNQKNDDLSSEDQTQSDQTDSGQTQKDQTKSDATAGNASSASSDSSQVNSTTSPAPETPAQTDQQHVTNYDSSSQDWQQMLQTISSATGLDQSNMTVWFLGSDKSNPGGSVGTISAKQQGSQKYRVYLQWNGSGYTATKVEPAS
ncbi:YrrS family protein [Bacillus sp. FJAT-29953]|nr:YrrS family protein [Bacillus sp. FJAT-29953]